MNSVINALIVDDELPARMALRIALETHPRWRIPAECSDATSALSAMQTHAVEVIFLDIRLPQTSGLEFARKLADMALPPLVIFVTAFESHAIEAFELHALDYVLKPFDDARLAAALERAAHMLSVRQRAAYADALRRYALPTSASWDHICVRSVGRIEKIALAEVNWIEGAGNYVQLHLTERCVLHRISMQRLEQQLDPAQFLRVHRCAIIRIAQIARLSVVSDHQYQLALRCGAVVPVSERYLPEIRICIGAQ